MPHQRFPKIEILSIVPHEIKFILSDTDVSVANALRRIMIAEVPTLAIDLVEFHENSTVLNDEYIAHRLGLLPICYSAPETLRAGDIMGAFLPHRECTCYERCPRCSVELELDVNYDLVAPTRPETEQDIPLTVTSVDLKSNNDLVAPAHFLNAEEQDEAQDDGISIVKIGPGQHLKVKCIARMGTAKEHAKWSPVAVATYRFWPNIQINQEACLSLTQQEKQLLVDTCPDRILELDDVSGRLKVSETAVETATFTEDLNTVQKTLKKRPEDDDFVTVEHTMDRFIFSVEGTGAMDAEEVLMSSLKVLKDRLMYLAGEVENLQNLQ